MNRKNLVIKLLAIAVLTLAGALLVVLPTLATPGGGVTPEPLAGGQLPEIVRAKFKVGQNGFESGFDISQVQMAKFTVAPGGYFGWHRHDGPVMVAIVSGELTFYEAGDATCTGTVYPAGAAFIETGEHSHNARNEGNTDVVVYATFMLPAGGSIRIDQPDPGACPF